MFVYSASDIDAARPLYCGEAFISATSLRRHYSGRISLLTNSGQIRDAFHRLPNNPFDDIHVMSAEEHPKLQKIKAIGRLAEGDVIFLDGDTIILDDLSCVFSFDTFDIAGVLAPWRENITSIDDALKRETHARYSLNSGVLFLSGSFAPELATHWGGFYEKALQRVGATAKDQPALQAALKELQPTLMTLPNNYNFRANMGGLISGKCFVVHCHFPAMIAAVIRSGFDTDVIDSHIECISTINHSMSTHAFGPIRSTTCEAFLRTRA